MNPFHEQSPDERFDRAVARRLAKLRTMPVDMSRLEQALRRQLPDPPRRWRQRLSQIRPLRAVAASIALIAIITAAFLTTASGPALASPAQMARMHQDLISGKTPVMQVDSIEAANQALAAQWPQSPQVPSMPADHVMACCMKSVKDKKVACVLLKGEGVPMTLTVANASDMRTPASPVVTRGSVAYHVQSYPVASGTLNMVMTERNGRWICLIGETSADRLMDIAARLQF